MIKRLFQICLLLVSFGVVKATTLTGVLPSPLGGTANGTLVLAISGTATVANGCTGSLPGTPYRFTLSSGVPSGTVVVGNDCLIPGNTNYNATFTDTNGNVFTSSWRITGTTFNLANQIFGVQSQINPTQTGNNYIQQPPNTNLSINNLKVDTCTGCGSSTFPPGPLTSNLVPNAPAQTLQPIVTSVGTFQNINADAQPSALMVPNGSGTFPVFALYTYDGTTTGTIAVNQCGDLACTPGLQVSVTLATGVGFAGLPVLRVGFDGTVKVFYWFGSAGPVKVYHYVNCTATATTSVCGTKTDNTVFTSTNNNGYALSMSLDAGNLGLLTWENYNDMGTSGTIQVRHCSNAACSASTSGTVVPATVVGSGGQFEMIANATSPDGTLLTAYNSYVDGKMHIARNNGTTLALISDNVVEDLMGNGFYVDLQVTAGNLAVMKYQVGGSPSTARYATCTNYACSSVTLSTAEPGAAVSLQLNGTMVYSANQLPSVNGNSGVLYSTCTIPCSTISSTVLTTSGGYPVSILQSAFPIVLAGVDSATTIDSFVFQNSAGQGVGAGTPTNPIGPVYLTQLTGVNQDGSFFSFALSSALDQFCRMVTGVGNVVCGDSATASGPNGVSVGQNTSSTGRGVAIGYTSSATDNTVAVGDGATASGGDSTVIGKGNSDGGFNGSVVLGHDNAPSGPNQFVAGGQSDFFLEGVADPGHPVTYHAPAGSGMDSAGSKNSFAGGQSTGNAAGGDACFQVSVPGMSGTSPNALADIICVSGTTGKAYLPYLTPSVPVLTDASKQLISGTLHGNTTRFQMSDNTGTAGNYTKFDASGNTVDGGGIAATLGASVNFLHINGTTPAPTVAAGGAIGTTPTVGSGSTDFVGTIAVPSTAVTTGTLFTITFGTAYSVAPHCWVTQNGGLVSLGVGHNTPGTTTLAVTAAIANVSAAAYSFDYGCSGN